jgi:adenosylhomocysteine nucleosidase
MPKHPLIGIVMATLLEAAPFLNTLELREVRGRPLRLYRRDDTVLVISGIGKANAAMATTYCCSLFRPQWILNLGAAGATGASFKLGDVSHIVKVVELDRPLLRTDEPRVHTPNVLRGFREAILATQDRAVIRGAHRRQISAVADLVDMEGAAVVQTCRMFGTRCILFKFISDTPGRLRHNDIIVQIRNHREAFCEFVFDSVIPVLVTQIPETDSTNCRTS